MGLSTHTKIQRKDLEMATQKHEAVLAYLLKDLSHEGIFYHVELIDVTDSGLIFSVDPALVEEGLFPDLYIDSRYLDSMGLELIIVPHPPELEH